MVEPVHTRDIARIAAEAIAAAGGGAAIARSLGIGRASVQQWKSAGIPAARAPAVARLTGIPLHDLRPDLFAHPMTTAPAPEGVAA